MSIIVSLCNFAYMMSDETIHLKSVISRDRCRKISNYVKTLCELLDK